MTWAHRKIYIPDTFTGGVSNNISLNSRRAIRPGSTSPPGRGCVYCPTSEIPAKGGMQERGCLEQIFTVLPLNPLQINMSHTVERWTHWKIQKPGIFAGDVSNNISSNSRGDSSDSSPPSGGTEYIVQLHEVSSKRKMLRSLELFFHGISFKSTLNLYHIRVRCGRTEKYYILGIF